MTDKVSDGGVGRDRLLELARLGAQRDHFSDLGVARQAAGHRGEMSTCPHPTCKLVREAVGASVNAQPPLTVGARVRLNEDIEQHNRIVVGTVKSLSPVGYVVVAWDQPNQAYSSFSPVNAAKELKVVTGRDALPRHDWDCQKDQPDPPCTRCGAIQTDENEHDACEPAAIPSASSAPDSELKGTYNCPVCGWNVPHSEHAGDQIIRQSQELREWIIWWQHVAVMLRTVRASCVDAAGRRICDDLVAGRGADWPSVRFPSSAPDPKP